MATDLVRRTRRATRRLAEPVDGASVAVFRALFGVLMFVGVVRFFAHGWITEQYVAPQFFFTYAGFGWVKPWPGWGMYLHFAALGALALCIAVGFHTRVSMALFFVGFTYVELLDKTNYLNHYYLVSILALLMTMMPLAESRLPRWCLLALRLQVGLVYFFAGVAKLRPDWLIAAQPLTVWLAARSDIALVGPVLAWPATAHFASWFGALFDLTFPFFMLHTRTRKAAFAVGVVFHAATGVLFELGMFPWIMICAALLFFEPSWPRRLVASRPLTALQRFIAPRAAATERRLSPLMAAALAVFFLLQALLPLRKHLHPGDVAWTEEGIRFAWHVMLMEKAGVVWFRVHDVDTGRDYQVSPRDYLVPRQQKMMSTSPDMIAQLAHHIADDFRARGHAHVEVYAEAYAALNGRRSAPLLAQVDLLETNVEAAIVPLP